MLQFLKRQHHLKDAERQATTDAANNVYEPERFIASLGLVPPDAVHDRTDVAVERARLVTQRTELHLHRTNAEDAITAGPARTGRRIAMVLIGVAEGVAIMTLFIRELEFSPAEAFAFSALLTPGSFYLTHLVRKHLAGTERRWWAFALLGVYAAFAVTLTYLRVAAHATQDASPLYGVAMGFLLCLTSLLPGWFLDHLRDDVAKTDAPVRHAGTMEIRIEQTSVEIERTEALTASIASHDAFVKQLRASYDTAHDTKRAQDGKPRLTIPPNSAPQLPPGDPACSKP